MFQFESKELDPSEVLDMDEVLRYVPNEALSPAIYDVFTDPDFVRSLPESLRDPKVLAEYLEHSSKFSDTKHNDSPIWGESVIVPETKHADGRVRGEPKLKEYWM